MLFDPKWTKADPSQLETLITWLEARQGRYTYACHDGCLLALYYRDHGYPDAELGTYCWYPFGEYGLQVQLPQHFVAIARDHPHTYAAARKRAAFFLEEVKRGVKWE